MIMRHATSGLGLPGGVPDPLPGYAYSSGLSSSRKAARLARLTHPEWSTRTMGIPPHGHQPIKRNSSLTAGLLENRLESSTSRFLSTVPENTMVVFTAGNSMRMVSPLSL